MAAPPFRLLSQSFALPLLGNLETAGQQVNGNMLRAKPVVPAPAGYSSREKGLFPLVRQLNAYCRYQNAMALALWEKRNSSPTSECILAICHRHEKLAALRLSSQLRDYFID